ncbi:hypothetical protein [Macrococcus animalis]|uniref:hypothetical protein n=1 Tax=Macrococcus animalis TaxID=3395467 RepID=UPI0039BF5FA9
MKTIEEIKTNILSANTHEVLTLDYIEFNKRRNEVTMNYVYQKFNPVEVHTAPHVTDPEMMDISTMRTLMRFLDDEGIRYEERNDDFI